MRSRWKLIYSSSTVHVPYLLVDPNLKFLPTAMYDKMIEKNSASNIYIPTVCSGCFRDEDKRVYTRYCWALNQTPPSLRTSINVSHCDKRLPIPNQSRYTSSFFNWFVSKRCMTFNKIASSIRSSAGSRILSFDCSYATITYTVIGIKLINESCKNYRAMRALFGHIAHGQETYATHRASTRYTLRWLGGQVQSYLYEYEPDADYFFSIFRKL